MTILQNIYYLSWVVLAIIVGTWYYFRKKGYKQIIPGKLILYSIGTTFTLFIIFIIAGHFFGNPAESTETTASSKTEQVSSKASSSTKSSSSSKKSSSEDKDANTILTDMSKSQLKKFNASLLNSLNEDQKFANNGKHGYEYATYIDTLAYSSRGLVVKVNSDFMSLNDAQKTTVGTGAQKLAAAQLVIMGKDISTDSSPIQTNVHYGADRIGHSKYTNGSEFKWTK